MAGSLFKYPFQCMCAGRAPSATHLYLACHKTLFQINAETAKLSAQWQAESSISILAVSHSSNRLAVVTADDKAIHILDAIGLGHRSRRLMPKRPSVLAFTPSDSHVLCADKFGDVYAVPVDHSIDAAATEPVVEDIDLPQRKPAADASTVHSKRNLRALENQMLSADKKMHRQQKSHFLEGAALAFTAEPVLGHVSMLSDLLCVPTSSTRQESHAIITADRDEHIRVSRGIPDSHVIHGFCLAHENFVSKTCALEGSIFISGGGDDFLCVWDWRSCRLLQKISLRALVDQARSHSEPGAGKEPIAVSGLWARLAQGSRCDIFCACEGLPSVLVITIDLASRSDDGYALTAKSISTGGNVLSLAFIGGEVLASLDNVHEAASTSQVRGITGSRVQCLQGSDAGSRLVDAATDLGDELNQAASRNLAQALYSIENIRKREYEDSEAD